MRLFVVEPLATGGMIHYAYQLCTAMAKAGAEVTLVTSESYELVNWEHNFKVEKRIKWWTLHDPQAAQEPASHVGKWRRKLQRTGRRALRGMSLIREWIRLSRYLLAERPDVVQFGKINFPFEAFFLAWLKRRGLFLSQICHEFELREQGNGLLVSLVNRMDRAVYAQFALIFLHGESNRRRFHLLFPSNVSDTAVIPHGNELIFQEQHGGEAVKQQLQQKYHLDGYTPVILFFGNLTPSKGLPHLLQAFALVQQQTKAKLIIAGYATKFIHLPDLQKMAADLAIADAVIFDARYLPISEVGPLMELATVVAYPYINSTQSGSLQVAYVFGKPVVATNVGGLPDVVEEGKSGFLVPPATPKPFCEALLKIITDADCAAKMGAYAHHLSQSRFAWEPIGQQIVARYQEKISDVSPS